MAGSFSTSNILFSSYHTLKRDGLWPIIKEYQKSQWYSYEDLKAIQENKLKLLLSHSMHNVPYYKNIFKDYNLIDENKLFDLANFSKLPILTKKDINKNRNYLIALNIKKNNLVTNSTSGSTGENLYFYQDKNASLNRQAVVWRNQAWVDCLYTDRQAFLWGAPFDVEKSHSLLGRLHSLFTKSISLSSYELAEETMWQYVIKLKKHKPKLFVSYPSPLATFAEFLLAHNLKVPSIKSIITSAEKLYPWQRSIIEKAFECSVFDRYGTREFGNIAHECDRHGGYHVNIERFYIEILNENGKPCQPKEMGEIIITDLDNYGFPFIRYRIEDMAIPSIDTCSCGRGLPLIQRIEGRSFDIVKAPNGNRIAGTFWTLTLRAVPGIDSFQIEQPSLTQLIVKIKPASNYVKNSEHKLLDTIKEKCGQEMKVDIVYVHEIPLTKSGKRRFVISNIDRVD
jgi:phenylacetate-CoA ligase